jgi:hypothetical protein
MNIEYLLLTYKNPEMFRRAFRSVYLEAYKSNVLLTVIDDCEAEAWDEMSVSAQPWLLGNDFAFNYIAPRDTMKQKKGHTQSRMGWGLNRAVAESNSDLIMMLCDDDIVVPGASAKILQWFEHNDIEQWAYGTSPPFDANGDFGHGLPVYEGKDWICGAMVDHEPQHEWVRTVAANVLGVQQVVWRRPSMINASIKWLDHSHPKRHPIDHQVFHQMDARFERGCPYIGFPVQYKGCWDGQVSRDSIEKGLR